MTPAALLALAQRLLCACRDPVTGEPLYAGVSADACVEDVEAAARYLRACAEAEPVATVRVHDTGGNAGIAWTGVPTENSGVMRGGTPLYTHPQPPSAQAEDVRQPMTEREIIGGFEVLPEALTFFTAFEAGVRHAERHHRIGREETTR